jgi:hypothetical protein
MQDAAAAMWHEPGWEKVILERPEVWGVQDLSADAIVMRVTARTAPMHQWEVARELRAQLKHALDITDAALPPAALGAAGQPGGPGEPAGADRPGEQAPQ